MVDEDLLLLVDEETLVGVALGVPGAGEGSLFFVGGASSALELCVVVMVMVDGAESAGAGMISMIDMDLVTVAGLGELVTTTVSGAGVLVTVACGSVLVTMTSGGLGLEPAPDPEPPPPEPGSGSELPPSMGTTEYLGLGGWRGRLRGDWPAKGKQWPGRQRLESATNTGTGSWLKRILKTACKMMQMQDDDGAGKRDG